MDKYRKSVGDADNKYDFYISCKKGSLLAVNKLHAYIFSDTSISHKVIVNSPKNSADREGRKVLPGFPNYMKRTHTLTYRTTKICCVQANKRFEKGVNPNI